MPGGVWAGERVQRAAHHAGHEAQEAQPGDDPNVARDDRQTGIIQQGFHALAHAGLDKTHESQRQLAPGGVAEQASEIEKDALGGDERHSLVFGGRVRLENAGQ